jgi:hypothetical protein
MEGISDSPASGLFISLAVTLSLYFWDYIFDFKKRICQVIEKKDKTKYRNLIVICNTFIIISIIVLGFLTMSGMIFFIFLLIWLFSLQKALPKC